MPESISKPPDVTEKEETEQKELEDLKKILIAKLGEHHDKADKINDATNFQELLSEICKKRAVGLFYLNTGVTTSMQELWNVLSFDFTNFEQLKKRITGEKTMEIHFSAMRFYGVHGTLEPEEYNKYNPYDEKQRKYYENYFAINPTDNSSEPSQPMFLSFLNSFFTPTPETQNTPSNY